MPVTFSPATHSAETFISVHHHTSASILAEACARESQKSDKILQSSFRGESISDIVPTTNGFVNTVKEAYNQHHALIIRPDDVWLAILVQFSSFVNANAEALRSQFFYHQGKKELKLVLENQSMVDFGLMARLTTKAIDDSNVTDPALSTWILPDFTTTIPNDTTVCSIAMMATMKQYFSYKCCISCGIPRVTLEGEKSDWEKVLVRLERLKEYGIQTIAWYHLLFPVISRFVKAFDAPHSAENLDFLGKVVHHEGGGNGPSYLCGWITAFCVFDQAGTWLGKTMVKMPDEPAMLLDPVSLSSADFFSTYTTQLRLRQDYLKLDGTPYHRIDTTDIPPGYLEIDVLLDDNGNKFNTLMVAGQIGMRISSSGDKTFSSGGLQDTVAPVAGWWMFTVKPQGGSKDQPKAFIGRHGALEDTMPHRERSGSVLRKLWNKIRK